QYPKANYYRLTESNKIIPCTEYTLKDRSIVEEFCYFYLKSRAYDLQIDSKQVIHGNIKDIYKAIKMVHYPRKEHNLE
ncbi:36868_t:CDS:1, partial [Gigaspora margarita]